MELQVFNASAEYVIELEEDPLPPQIKLVFSINDVKVEITPKSGSKNWEQLADACYDKEDYQIEWEPMADDCHIAVDSEKITFCHHDMSLPLTISLTDEIRENLYDAFSEAADITELWISQSRLPHLIQCGDMENLCMLITRDPKLIHERISLKLQGNWIARLDLCECDGLVCYKTIDNTTKVSDYNDDSFTRHESLPLFTSEESIMVMSSHEIADMF